VDDLNRVLRTKAFSSAENPSTGYPKTSARPNSTTRAESAIPRASPPAFGSTGPTAYRSPTPTTTASSRSCQGPARCAPFSL